MTDGKLRADVYYYARSRLESALNRCQWTDRVGKLFGQNIMSRIGTRQMKTEEAGRFLAEAERQLNQE